MSLGAAHTFPSFASQPDLVHGCFHRHGGISPTPHDSFNISYGVGDDPDNVLHNRALVKETLGCRTLISSKQVHGDQIAIVEDMATDQELEGYDALITSQPGIALLIQQADCQAVLLYDPKHKVVANIHCGWKGSVSNIIAKTVQRMGDEFHSDPSQIIAAISPSLGPCCAEFINYKQELPESFHPFEVAENHFDFLAISIMQLKESGVQPKLIETADICTRCDEDWFSYRRNRQTGRFCTVIGLQS